MYRTFSPPDTALTTSGCPPCTRPERLAWRFVIYLNLVRSIRRILEAIAPEDNSALDDDDFGDSSETASIIISGSGRPSSSLAGSQPNYEHYRRRLAPLMEMEQRLINMLSDPEDNEGHEATHLPPSSSFTADARTLHHANSMASLQHAGGRPAPRITIPAASTNASSSSFAQMSVFTPRRNRQAIR
ncbi:hypothetical protein NUW54_g14517 [Trametes sanguinea]|uniref:Uncharacterized protein n=1 Tax=Trametes sanguinea TaxID=158606 RepID=A0ACC1MBP1_9APHY|nr:hypothetical protein NUW54_g14517 [Trametes sanguinea]